MEKENDVNNLDDGLQSQSLKGIESCSSLILDSDEDDGVNVTIRKVEIGKGDDGVLLKNDKTKGCGSARRRLKKLVQDGLTTEEARKKIMSSTPNRTRNADLDASNSAEAKPALKKFREVQKSLGPSGSGGGKGGAGVNSGNDGGQGITNGQGTTSTNKQTRKDNLPAPTYQQIVNRVRLGIIPIGYPDVELSSDQQEAVKEALLKLVLNQRREPFKPKFVHCTAKTGHVLLSCQDRDTANWVSSAVSRISPWENVALEALDEHDLPHRDILLAFFYRSVNDDNETICGYLESQNDNLDISKWNILHRTPRKEHVDWAFTVDSASIQLLEVRKFVVNYKFGQTLLRKKRHVNGNQQVEDKPEGMDVEHDDGPTSMIIEQHEEEPGAGIPQCSGIAVEDTIKQVGLKNFHNKCSFCSTTSHEQVEFSFAPLRGYWPRNVLED